MIDKRLTEEEKKKIKPANQGGGPNYLGKQETVTVPKKWLSSPDHVVAELAYITPREQKILLNADIYGSLKGKPNKGPGGIMSLQGDMGSVGGGSSNGGGNNDRPNIGQISGPVTSSFTDADDNRDNYKTDQYTTGPTTTTTDPDESTIDELTPTFAPIEQPTLFQQFVDGIKNIGKTAFKGYVAVQTFGALGLSPKAVAIGDTVLGLTNDIGLTKSKNISELGLNAVTGIADVFSGNTNKGNTNTNSFSGNTNNGLSDNNQNNGGEGGNNDVLSSEYILLLQKMQLGNFTQEDQTRFNLLKTMLGK